MLPVVKLGITDLSTYWIMLAIGAIGMLVCVYKRRARFLLSGLQCVAFTCLLTVVGFTGAKLLYILENIQHTLENGVSLGGVSFYGSVFLIPLLIPIIGKTFSLRSNQSLDICGPCVSIMIGCMRFGCYLQGCCGGNLVSIGSFAFRWPTQAIESIGDFAILLVLLNWEKRGLHHGKLYPIFMVLYSIMRFLIEFLRNTPKDWSYLSHGQWFAISAIIVGMTWFMKTDVDK